MNLLGEKIHDEAWEKTKSAITTHPVLTYFNRNEVITLQVDVSQNGVGAAIFQNGKPVAFASKAFNESEKYAQIEKELYAISFGCTRFHNYLYHQEFTVESDHKPLEAIMKKPLYATPPRLQCMLLHLQKYRLNIVYIPGKDIPVADTLSRHYMSTGKPEDDQLSEDIALQIHAVLSRLQVCDEKISKLRKCTQNDPKMRELQRVIMHGWPETRKECSQTTAEFFNHCEELTIMDNIILKGDHPNYAATC